MYSKILEYFRENEDVFNETIEELDSYNGYLGDDRYYPMEEMDDLFSGQSAEWILCRAFFGYDEETYTINSDGTKEYGPFNPCRDYFSFNGYGNLVSADYKDYSAYLGNHFIDELIDNCGNLFLNDEVVELLDELENDDDENDD